MSRVRSESRRASSLIVLLLVGVLAVVAVLLAVYALRTPASPDAGQLPDPAPTFGGARGTAAPTPTPTTSAPAISADPQIMTMADGKTGLRATHGSCSGKVAPVVQLTDDGGATWSTVNFDGVAVTQVLSARFGSDGQIDVVATDASCTPVMVSSFTSGQFWQAYPERVGEGLFVDPRQTDRISDRGVGVTAPCLVLQVVDTPPGLAALCTDGSVQLYTASSRSWAASSASGVLALSATNGASVIAATTSQADCRGVGITSISVSAAPATAPATLSCLTPNEAQAAVTLSAAGGELWYWSSSTTLRSPDGGSTWVPTA